MPRRRRIPRRADLWPRLWRRNPVAAAVLVLVIVLVAWGRLRVPLGDDFDRYHNRTVTCVNVVDGDTIDINVPDGRYPHTRIRLWGVDTPETKSSDRGVMYFGPEASAFTRDLVLDKPVRVVLAPDRTRDKYDRLLAYVYLADTDRMLNEELLAEGLAYADRRFNHPWKPRFIDLEARARRSSKGLWKHVTPDQLPEWLQRYEAWRDESSSSNSP